MIDGDQFEGKGKPDPASYEVALQRLNIKPSDAVVVENAPGLGIELGGDQDNGRFYFYKRYNG